MLDEEVICLLVSDDSNDNRRAIARLLSYKPESAEEAQILANLLLPFFQSESVKEKTLANTVFGVFKKAFPAIDYPKTLQDSPVARQELEDRIVTKVRKAREDLRQPVLDVEERVEDEKLSSLEKKSRQNSMGFPASIFWVPFALWLLHLLIFQPSTDGALFGGMILFVTAIGAWVMVSLFPSMKKNPLLVLAGMFVFVFSVIVGIAKNSNRRR